MKTPKTIQGQWFIFGDDQQPAVGLLRFDPERSGAGLGWREAVRVNGLKVEELMVGKKWRVQGCKVLPGAGQSPARSAGFQRMQSFGAGLGRRQARKMVHR